LQHKIKINNHYNKLIDDFGFTKAGIGWKSNKLNARYKIFTRNINFNKSTVLDFGCGLCHFFFYLKKKKIKFKEYYGYDINKKILKYLKDKNIKNLKLSSIFPKKKVDIIISNGVYNYNYKSNKKIMYSDIQKLYKLSNKTVGISILNDNVDFKEKHLFYHNIEELTKFIEKKVTKNLKIDNSFKGYESFIILNK